MKKFLFLFLGIILFIACSKSSDDAPSQVNKSANLLATGASASDILSNAAYNSMVIEVAHVGNFQPTERAMLNLLNFLRNNTFKQDITVKYKVLDSPNEETLTLQEVADLENENRTEYNDGTTLAIYIYFADAPSESDDEDSGVVTLGAVYRNTSMVIHEGTIRRLTARSTFVSLADAETATLTHEFGHLFGLVNLGTPAINPITIVIS